MWKTEQLVHLTMRTVTIQEAQKQLSCLIDAAATGESFIITRAGKPLVKVFAVEASRVVGERRIGFLDGQIAVPEDFDRMGSTEIQTRLEGGE